MDNWWDTEVEDGISDEGYEALEEALEEAESDISWTQATLEALEWVLGETDVRPELVTEEEAQHATGESNQEQTGVCGVIS